MCCRQTAGSPITLPNPSSLLTSFTLVETRNSKHLCPVSFTARRSYDRGIKLIFTGGHISLAVAFKGLNVILGLYKCNYSLPRGKELGAAAGQQQGARSDKTRWRAGFGPRALCLPPCPMAYFGPKGGTWESALLGESILEKIVPSW